MNEELINQIVRRILSDPALQPLLERSLDRHGDAQAPKQDGLILLNYVPDFERVLTALKTRYGAEYHLNILPSDQVFRANPELPVGLTWISAEDALSKREWQKLILPACSPNLLAKAALGIRDNPMSELIGRGICAGTSLELCTEYLGLTERTPQAYRDLYAGYLQQVQAYGVKVCSLEDQGAPESSKSTKTSPVGQTTREELRYTQKFLGDKQAYGIPEDSKVRISSGTVISPLARDTLKLRRIELCVEKEERR